MPLVSWVTLSGWRERWHWTLGGVKAIYTLARCRKFVPGFSLPAFKADALLLYEEVCQAIAADDKTLLRQVLTHVMLPFSVIRQLSMHAIVMCNCTMYVDPVSCVKSYSLTPLGPYLRLTQYP